MTSFGANFWKQASAVTLAIIGSGFFGVLISSIYSDQIAKREITADVLRILSENIQQSSSIPTNLKNASDEQLSILLAQKQHAFLIRKMTRFLEKNYPEIRFEDLLPAVNAIETRYSFARIYEAAGMVNVVCENLSFSPPNRTNIVLNTGVSKCDEKAVQFLSGITIELAEASQPDQGFEVSQENQNFRITITEDSGNHLCHQRDRTKNHCNFSVDLTDRIENLPFEYMVLLEFVGYKDSFLQLEPVVYFSIVKKRTADDEDRSYWDYQLVLTKDIDSGNECEDFFDQDDTTTNKPAPPSLDNFDRGVLRACGPIRGNVTRAEFKHLISDNYAAFMRSMKLHPKRWAGLTKEVIINDLHRIWTIDHGFNHVFCGDWDRGSIGGLHDRGRYFQLQMEGQACYKPSPMEDTLEDKVYTIGVRSNDGANQHDIKGYALNYSALELFVFATQGFYEFMDKPEGWYRDTGGEWSKNIYLEDRSSKTPIKFRLLAHSDTPQKNRTYGIKTIYPDITPNEGYPIKSLKTQ